MFRNYTFNDLQRLKQIDTFSYLQRQHFTNNPSPELPYFNESETIPSKSKEDQQRIVETIKKLTPPQKII
jgi:hypothetical protein